MPPLPDSFDLWIRRARAWPEPARQADYVLGALLALPAWHFLNLGTRGQPLPASSLIEDEKNLFVFSSTDRVLEVADRLRLTWPAAEPPVITIPAARALDWCVEERPLECQALLINPGEDAVAIPIGQVAAFAREWHARGGLRSSGFWIPNLTGEEESFWLEHGL